MTEVTNRRVFGVQHPNLFLETANNPPTYLDLLFINIWKLQVPPLFGPPLIYLARIVLIVCNSEVGYLKACLFLLVYADCFP